MKYLAQQRGLWAWPLGVASGRGLAKTKGCVG